MNIPSVSGDEESVGFYLRDYLQSLGWTVELQKVSENQNNVIAYLTFVVKEDVVADVIKRLHSEFF